MKPTDLERLSNRLRRALSYASWNKMTWRADDPLIKEFFDRMQAKDETAHNLDLLSWRLDAFDRARTRSGMHHDHRIEVAIFMLDVGYSTGSESWYGKSSGFACEFFSEENGIKIDRLILAADPSVPVSELCGDRLIVRDLSIAHWGSRPEVFDAYHKRHVSEVRLELGPGPFLSSSVKRYRAMLDVVQREDFFHVPHFQHRYTEQAMINLIRTLRHLGGLAA